MLIYADVRMEISENESMPNYRLMRLVFIRRHDYTSLLVMNIEVIETDNLETRWDGIICGLARRLSRMLVTRTKIMKVVRLRYKTKGSSVFNLNSASEIT